MTKPSWFSIVAVCLLLTLPASANVKLPGIFSSNMVLQRNMKLPIWGWADPGEEVSVAIDKQIVKTTADAKGKWVLKLDAMEAGGPYKLIVTGKNTVTFDNVLVGEVWLCSGQSNMVVATGQAYNAEAEKAKADYPQIRLFQVHAAESDTPDEDLKGTYRPWAACTPTAVHSFSAVGYFFGREIHKTLNVPVGLIESAQGASPAEAWTSMDALSHDEELTKLVASLQDQVKSYPQDLARYQEKDLLAWQAMTQKAAAEGRKLTPAELRPPQPPEDLTKSMAWRFMPTRLFNARINPLIPYGIAGVIWYQGESNTHRSMAYQRLFPMMIQDWRARWGEGDFPFLFVQLCNGSAPVTAPAPTCGTAELREAQLMTLKVPKTGMAVTIDIGDAKTAHPINKQDVGHRLALAALHVAYGKDIVYSGPIYDAMIIEEGKVRLKFKHTGSGLLALDYAAPSTEPFMSFPRSAPTSNLKGFAIAGKDKKFVWADAKIDGDSVIVSNDQVKEPVAVRYGWADNPDCNLYNKEGLPASPFRTDD